MMIPRQMLRGAGTILYVIVSKITKLYENQRKRKNSNKSEDTQVTEGFEK